MTGLLRMPQQFQRSRYILYGDGHVAWESNAFVGVNRDNIYVRAKGPNDPLDPDANGGDTANPFGSPYDANDSILLPTDD